MRVIPETRRTHAHYIDIYVFITFNDYYIIMRYGVSPISRCWRTHKTKNSYVAQA